MALRHNISDNPQMLGLAKSKVAQLRSTMAKKTKHLSQIIKTKDGLMKLRIAGENEYAYLLKKSSQWVEVAKFDGNISWPENVFNLNEQYAFVVPHEIHTVYVVLNDAGINYIRSRFDGELEFYDGAGNTNFIELERKHVSGMLEESPYYDDFSSLSMAKLVPDRVFLMIRIPGLDTREVLLSINTKYFNNRGAHVPGYTDA